MCVVISNVLPKPFLKMKFLGRIFLHCLIAVINFNHYMVWIICLLYKTNRLHLCVHLKLLNHNLHILNIFKYILQYILKKHQVIQSLCPYTVLAAPTVYFSLVKISCSSTSFTRRIPHECNSTSAAMFKLCSVWFQAQYWLNANHQIEIEMLQYLVWSRVRCQMNLKL